MLPAKLNALFRQVYIIVSELHWGVLLLIVLLHMGLSFGLMSIAKEADLVQPVAFLYWYMTTALTVGYGDLSPKSDLGRMAAAFFVMPGAIACFTAAIAKTLEGVADIWRQRRIGLGDFSDMKNMIVLIGYDADRTPQMIDEIVADTAGRSEIVLYTRKQIDNIDPRYRYVRASSLTSRADLERAGVPVASKIVIYTPTDDEAIAAGLAAAALNDEAHIVAYFRERSNADLLHAHCPNIETVLTPSVELLVKSLSDPGSSQLITELASHTDDGATLYTARAADGGTFAAVAERLRSHHAVLVAFSKDGMREMHFDFEGNIAAGDKLFYVAKQRLPAAGA